MATTTDTLLSSRGSRSSSEEQIGQTTAPRGLQQRTGMKITHVRALEIFSGAGDRVLATVQSPVSWWRRRSAKRPPEARAGQPHGQTTVVLGRDKVFRPSLDRVDYLDPQPMFAAALRARTSRWRRRSATRCPIFRGA